MPDNKLILASTSPFRKTLLDRLGIPFEQRSPDCDETPHSGEESADLVMRLAVDKAQSVMDKLDESAIVIGSDQVADHNGAILGKPHTHDNAVAQLKSLSGNTVMFHTGLCISSKSRSLTALVSTEVRYRSLTEEQIERYLKADEPYNCAASFKSECMGSAIVDYMRSDDPSALIGLPLIKVAQFLGELGIEVP